MEYSLTPFGSENNFTYMVIVGLIVALSLFMLSATLFMAIFEKMLSKKIVIQIFLGSVIFSFLPLVLTYKTQSDPANVQLVGKLTGTSVSADGVVWATYNVEDNHVVFRIGVNRTSVLPSEAVIYRKY